MYQVVMSASDNLDSIEKAESTDSGIVHILNWTKATVSLDILGLEFSGKYFFNVIVRDKAFNKALYKQVSVEPDKSVPPVPGKSGEINILEASSDFVSLAWEKADDDLTASENLVYKVLMSTSDNIKNITVQDKNNKINV